MRELIIEPGRAERNYWRDLWRFRELFYFLAWRDLLVRYKQTVIGVAWALLRPALTMLVFVGVRKVAKLTVEGVPDALFVFAAVLPWQFFSTALSEASGSLVGNANLISKVYFPRLIIPAGAVVTSLVDFLITLAILAVLMVWYQFPPGWQILFLPLLVLLTFGLSIGAGLLLAALNVEYRDFRYIVPFIVQFGVFVSPIWIGSAQVMATFSANSSWFHWLFAVNPLVGIIDGFRWSILAGRTPFDSATLAVSVGVTMVMLGLGIWYFRRTERTFADVI